MWLAQSWRTVFTSAPGAGVAAAGAGRCAGSARTGISPKPASPASATIDEHEAGKLSDAAVHDLLIAATENLLAPIRARRASFQADDGLIEEILVDGTIRAREVAYKTLQQVREAMGLDSLWKGLIDVAQHRAEARKKPY